MSLVSLSLQDIQALKRVGEFPKLLQIGFEGTRDDAGMKGQSRLR
jgi:hypothetical protein